jgi:DNA-binding transcriptional ArsR family regulator
MVPDEPILDAGLIVGLLADASRRRVVAALVLGASTVEEIRAATGLDARQAVTALGRLVDAELVVRDDQGAHFIIEEAFRVAAIAAAPAAGRNDVQTDAPADAARVLRAFVRDGRLTAIPSHHGKRLIILDVLAQELELGRRYTEREVNAILRRWHDDTAALRRYLVDDGFLDREAGQYWRTGGSVDV